MCVDGGIGIRKLEKLSHTRVPEKDVVSVIIGEAYQAVTSADNIVKVWSRSRGIKAGVFSEIRIIVFFMQCVDMFVIP